MNDTTNEIEDDTEELDNEPISARKPAPIIDDEPEDEASQQPRREAKNAKELIMEEMPLRARRVATKLRSYLTAKIVLEITDKGDRYLFDWSENEPKSSVIKEIPKLKNEDDATDQTGIDCYVKLKEQELMAIQSGDLNPQIAIVNEKVKVEGKPGLAMYLFNLVYPRAHLP